MTDTLPTFPDGVRAKGTISVAFQLTVADVESPKLTEVQASGGLQLSCYLTGFNVSLNESTGADTRVCTEID